MDDEEGLSSSAKHSWREEKGNSRKIGSAEQCIFRACGYRAHFKHEAHGWFQASHGLVKNEKVLALLLAVAGYGAQLAGQKVVRWPGAADRHFAVFQLLGGGG